TLFPFLRSAGAALINEHDFVVPRQGQKIAKKTTVRSAWPTMHDHQRLTTTENFVVDHHTVRVHESFLHRVHIGLRRSLPTGCGICRCGCRCGSSIGGGDGQERIEEKRKGMSFWHGRNASA